MEENKKFKVNSEDTLLESRDIHTYFETNSQEEAMGYFLYKDFVEENKAFENKTNNGKRYFIADENGELSIDFSQMTRREKHRLINLYKENNAEHFKNEERFEQIKEETAIQMGDPFGEYRNEIKGNEMKKQKNEELAIYSVDYYIQGVETPDEGYVTAYFTSKERADNFIRNNEGEESDYRFFYDENRNVEEPKKITDLLEMKEIAHNENARGNNGEFFHFEKRIDKALEEMGVAEKNQEKLSLYVVSDNDFGIGELAFNRDQAYNIAEEMSSDDVHISEEMTDLIKIKKAISWNVEANYGDYPNESIKAFEQKVDEKLVEHICDKFYSGYDGCEKDREAFKENGVQYNHDGVITKIQATDNQNWIDINHYLIKDINHLDEAFENKGAVIDWTTNGGRDNFKIKVDGESDIEPDINLKSRTKSHPKVKSQSKSSKKDKGRDI